MEMWAAMDSGEDLLDKVQSDAFRYFLRAVNPDNGLVADNLRPGAHCSIAATGFALACYPVGVERKLMTREQAAGLTLAALRFFSSSPQGEEPDATGFHGFYYHFLDMKKGRRAWMSELSLIDSAFLLAGVLTAARYFNGVSASEAEIRELSQLLYLRADWTWALNDRDTITHGWKPECGFLNYGWHGYSEAILLYVMALGSPSHRLARESYHAWTTTYQWENLYGHDVLYAGPLFIHQYSHLWIDFRGIHDAFMRESGIDYFANSRRAAYMQRRYALHNPGGFASYGADCWGISACDGPGPCPGRLGGAERRFFGYAARGVPHGPDDGTLSPAAVVGCLPFAPEIVLPVLLRLHRCHPRVMTEAGLRSFNDSFDCGPTQEERHRGRGWVCDTVFGIDNGTIVLSIENHRSGFLWNLMKEISFIEAGLRASGFRDGWLG